MLWGFIGKLDCGLVFGGIGFGGFSGIGIILGIGIGWGKVIGGIILKVLSCFVYWFILCMVCIVCIFWYIVFNLSGRLGFINGNLIFGVGGGFWF